MNWMLFATKLPALVSGAMALVERIKGASGADKKAAVIASVPEAVALLEFGAGKDVLNDPAIAQLVSAYVDAEAAAMKARDALKQGLLAAQPV